MTAVGVEWFAEQWPVSRETLGKLKLFHDLICAENRIQNLVAESTLPDFWNRHVLDSAQLVALATDIPATWLDVGSGAGLPGIVTSLLTQAKHVLIEPRRRRAEFLATTVAQLRLDDRVEVAQTDVRNVSCARTAVITARAFASLTKTLAATAHLGGPGTMWLLHKGRSFASEVAEAEKTWTGRFEAIPSLTDSAAAIVRVCDLERRKAS